MDGFSIVCDMVRPVCPAAGRPRLRQVVDVYLQAALEVARLVLVDHVPLRQLVQHRVNLREKRVCRTLVRSIAESFHRVARCFVVIAVAKTACFRLADPLFS